MSVVEFLQNGQIAAAPVRFLKIEGVSEGVQLLPPVLVFCFVLHCLPKKGFRDQDVNRKHTGIIMGNEGDNGRVGDPTKQFAFLPVSQNCSGENKVYKFENKVAALPRPHLCWRRLKKKHCE